MLIESAPYSPPRIETQMLVLFCKTRITHICNMEPFINPIISNDVFKKYIIPPKMFCS